MEYLGLYQEPIRELFSPAMPMVPQDSQAFKRALQKKEQCWKEAVVKIRELSQELVEQKKCNPNYLLVQLAGYREKIKQLNRELSFLNKASEIYECTMRFFFLDYELGWTKRACDLLLCCSEAAEYKETLQLLIEVDEICRRETQWEGLKSALLIIKEKMALQGSVKDPIVMGEIKKLHTMICERVYSTVKALYETARVVEKSVSPPASPSYQSLDAPIQKAEMVKFLIEEWPAVIPQQAVKPIVDSSDPFFTQASQEVLEESLKQKSKKKSAKLEEIAKQLQLLEKELQEGMKAIFRSEPVKKNNFAGLIVQLRDQIRTSQEDVAYALFLERIAAYLEEKVNEFLKLTSSKKLKEAEKAQESSEAEKAKEGSNEPKEAEKVQESSEAEKAQEGLIEIKEAEKAQEGLIEIKEAEKAQEGLIEIKEAENALESSEAENALESSNELKEAENALISALKLVDEKNNREEQILKEVKGLTLAVRAFMPFYQKKAETMGAIERRKRKVYRRILDGVGLNILKRSEKAARGAFFEIMLRKPVNGMNKIAMQIFLEEGMLKFLYAKNNLSLAQGVLGIPRLDLQALYSDSYPVLFQAYQLNKKVLPQSLEPLQKVIKGFSECRDQPNRHFRVIHYARYALQFQFELKKFNEQETPDLLFEQMILMAKESLEILRGQPFPLLIPLTEYQPVYEASKFSERWLFTTLAHALWGDEQQGQALNTLTMLMSNQDVAFEEVQTRSLATYLCFDKEVEMSELSVELRVEQMREYCNNPSVEHEMHALFGREKCLQVYDLFKGEDLLKEATLTQSVLFFILGPAITHYLNIKKWQKQTRLEAEEIANLQKAQEALQKIYRDRLSLTQRKEGEYASESALVRLKPMLEELDLLPPSIEKS